MYSGEREGMTKVIQDEESEKNVIVLGLPRRDTIQWLCSLWSEVGRIHEGEGCSRKELEPPFFCRLAYRIRWNTQPTMADNVRESLERK